MKSSILRKSVNFEEDEPRGPTDDQKEKAVKDTGRENDIIRLKAELIDGDSRLGKTCEGLCTLVERSPRIYYLRFVNLKINNPKRHQLSIKLYTEKIRPSNQSFIDNEGVEVQIAGTFLFEAHERPLDFEIPLQDVVMDDSPLKEDMTLLQTVCFVKLADNKPKTSNGVLFGLGNFETVSIDWANAEELERRVLERRENIEKVEKIMKEMENAPVAPIKDVKQKAKMAFIHFNLDKEGVLTFDKFKEVLQHMNLFMSDAKYLQLFRVGDVDGSGTIDFKEFQDTLRVQNKMPPPKPLVSPWEMFQTFDTNNSGYLDELEFYEVIRSLGFQVTTKQCSKMFKEADLDNSGTLEMDEFEKLWVRVADVPEEISKRGGVVAKGWNAKKKNIATILEMLKKEAEDYESEFQRLKAHVLDMKTKRRLAKDAKKKAFEELRVIEDRIIKKEMAIKLKEDRLRAKEAKEFIKMREKKEKFLRQELEEQIKLRLDLEARERERERKEKQQNEEEERVRKGKDKIISNSKSLEEVPSHYYKGQDAQNDLVFVIMCDFSHNLLTELPGYAFLFWLSSLQKLDLSNNKMASIPKEIGGLKTLKILKLNNNELEALPDEINDCSALEILDISHNQLTKLPNELSGLSKRLSSLFLYNNAIVVLPSGIGKLSNLKMLELHMNKLEELPLEFGDLKSLRHLDMSWNFLKHLPATIGGLKNLKYMNMESNHITKIPESFKQLANLEVAHFGRNDIRELNNCIGGLTSMVDMDFSRNGILKLSDKIGDLRLLNILNLSHNQLEAIPTSIGHLIYLHTLNFRFNKIKDVPEEIGALRSLHKIDLAFNDLNGEVIAAFGTLLNLAFLDLSHNHIQSINANLGSMVSLSDLNLSHNILTALPESFGKLKKLSKLNLSTNLIEHLPIQLGKLQNLKVLDASANRIIALPKELAKCSSMMDLDLYNNNLKAIPPEIAHIMPNLDTFNVSRNPLTDLPNKWCKTWNLKDKYSNLWSGYTNAEASVWTVVQSKIHEAAKEEWAMTGYMHFNGRSTMDDFAEAVRVRVGPDWNEQCYEAVCQFYFLSKREGLAPRYDDIQKSEIETRTASKEASLAIRNKHVQDAKDAEKKMEIQKSVNYRVNPWEIKRHMKELDVSHAERMQEKKKKELSSLRSMMKAHYEQQEASRKQREDEKMKKKKEEIRLLQEIVYSNLKKKGSDAQRKSALNKTRDVVYM